jgi:small subunit ribosomal protein S4e
MARKFGSRQLKREMAPSFWPIHRKEETWATMTHPGPHPRERSLPLVVLLRNTLGYAQTAKEAIRIIHDSKVKVDGIVRRDHRFPAGLMDVVQIAGVDKVFRVLPKPGRGLSLSPIGPEEAGYKLCKITGKKTLSGTKVQVNLHDGRNLLLQSKPPTSKGEEEFSVGGTLQIGVPSQKLMKYIPFQPGSFGLVIDGRNEGLYGKIASISEGSHSRPRIARVETAQESFETPAKYIIPVGTDKSLVSLDR